MSDENDDGKVLLPHHEQQALCATRAPYRQGRKLTAVKVYTINSESNHLLIFGVPSLNLRQEVKALFHKFGKLKVFNLTTEYKTEQFTETYHAAYENIQSARMAKRMLDTKNFYGGSLHVTYAPELESFDETEAKLARRKFDVLARLRNLKKEDIPVVKKVEVNIEESIVPKLNMGEENVIKSNGVVVRKRKYKQDVVEERFRPCFVENKVIGQVENNITTTIVEKDKGKSIAENCNIQIVDCTSTSLETITNINEHLNVDKFDNLKIYKVPEKPVNKIKFNVNKKS